MLYAFVLCLYLCCSSLYLFALSARVEHFSILLRYSDCLNASRVLTVWDLVSRVHHLARFKYLMVLR